jgi:hypothetical protein
MSESVVPSLKVRLPTPESRLPRWGVQILYPRICTPRVESTDSGVQNLHSLLGVFKFRGGESALPERGVVFPSYL